MSESGFYKIRPAARLIKTIGEDLIGDVHAAVIELVKNSYDADATKVEIYFMYPANVSENKELKIIIKDNGHGMDFDTIINKWLVPATNDKLNRKTSPNGRVLQGRKGIGRYAAAILGQELSMTSVDNNHNKTTVVIDWREFDQNKFLQDVDLLVETEMTAEEHGTILQIVARDEDPLETNSRFSAWTEQELDKLWSELRKLISPFRDIEQEKVVFEVDLFIENSPFERYSGEVYTIEPFPIIDLYDYRLYGTIDEEGHASLVYENNVTQPIQKEDILKQFKLEAGMHFCGFIDFDFRVFDRDSSAIDNLIQKGLYDDGKERFIGKNEAKKLLNQVYGVNVYRNKFRIRPYGNGGIDWLDLDKDRIQNPTLRISNNQIAGFVTIQQEDISHLEEKSARDGLKENSYYFGLVYLLKRALDELERRRFTYRRKIGTENVKRDVYSNVSKLFDFSGLKEKITDELSDSKSANNIIERVNEIIEEEQNSKAGLLEEINNTIAIYQTQAALGNIVSYVLHEGRKPVSYFLNQSNNVQNWLIFYKAKPDPEVFDDLISAAEDFKGQSRILSELFRSLEPLARRSRSRLSVFSVRDEIVKAERLFRSQLLSGQIEFRFSCEPSITLTGHEEDLYTALTNLIDNSIYWLDQIQKTEKEIAISVTNDNGFILDYHDNGPGLQREDVEAENLFVPGFTRKLNGTGLGLAIAGEALSRLDCTLKAFAHSNGAYFRIEKNISE